MANRARVRLLLTLAALATANLAVPPCRLKAAEARTPQRVIAPLVEGDEAIVVTTHRIKLAHGVLDYEARAGRLAIRNDQTGEVRAHIYFTAYVVKSTGPAPRPLTFLWNGGPTAPSVLVHTEMFGPRRVTAQGMVDNPETLLAHSDLVFYDPVETGFSRPAQADDKEFLSVLGDFAETAEFVRAYRARFSARHQSLFLGGESYGTWRVCGVTEMLTKQGIRVNGAILISGGIPGSLMPYEFQDAMYVPARTATAFELKKLPPDLMRDKAATMKAVNDWAYDTYMPALSHVNDLTPEQRDAIANDLARYTGVKPEQIDRKTLVMPNNAFKSGLFEGDKARVLNTYDMRIVGPEHELPSRIGYLSDYFRNELGYSTDLAYAGLEPDAYLPLGSAPRRGTGERFRYDHVQLTEESQQRMKAGGGPPLSQPWLQNAMRQDPQIKVFVAAGRYDSLNMCEGNVRMAQKLEPPLSGRFTEQCYEGGHMMYREQPTRLKLSEDIGRFIAAAH